MTYLYATLITIGVGLCILGIWIKYLKIYDPLNPFLIRWMIYRLRFTWWRISVVDLTLIRMAGYIEEKLFPR
jgi:hypothetical protein